MILLKWKYEKFNFSAIWEVYIGPQIVSKLTEIGHNKGISNIFGPEAIIKYELSFFSENIKL